MLASSPIGSLLHWKYCYFNIFLALLCVLSVDSLPNETRAPANFSNLSNHHVYHNCDVNKLPSTLLEFLNTSCLIAPPERILGKPELTIVILSHNNGIATYRLLVSLFMQNYPCPTEFIYFDDASNDPYALELLNRIQQSTSMRTISNNKKPLGYGKANNKSVEQSSPHSKYVLLLNNDMELLPGFVMALYVDITSTRNITGAVGCKIISPSGLLQEAGSMIFNDGSAHGYGRSDDPKLPEYNHRRSVDYVSGACLMVQKAAYKSVGGFDHKYDMYYEDTDLQMKIRYNLKLDIIYQPLAEAIHQEHASSSKIRAVQHMRISSKVFRNQWESVLKNERYPPSEIFCSRDARSNEYPDSKQLRILVIDQMCREADFGSGYGRAIQVVTAIRSLGHLVSVYQYQNQSWSPIIPKHRQLGIDVYTKDTPDKGSDLNNRMSSLHQYLYQRAGKYDVIIISRPRVFTSVYPIVRLYFPYSIPVVYDAEGVWFQREQVFLQVMNSSSRSYTKQRKEELKIFQRANMSWFVSEQDAQTVMNHSNPNLKLKYHIITTEMPLYRKSDGLQMNQMIGFLGAFHSSKYYNGDAILYFINKVYPIISKWTQRSELHICGANPPSELSHKHDPKKGIHVHGKCEDLSDFFTSIRVFVAPHQYGCGIQDKVLRSLSYGVPVVLGRYSATALGLKGDGSDGVLIADNATSFAENVYKILTDNELYGRLRQGCYNIMDRKFSKESFRESISNALSSFTRQSCLLN